MTEQNATIRTVEHGEASELPELGWFWRRTFAFGFTVACLLFAWRISERVTDVGTLRMGLRYSLGLVALMSLLYMAGASTEAITKLFAAVRTTRKETLTTAPPVGKVVSTAAGTSATTAGDEDDGALPPEARVRL